jgi:galactofuranosylgalactofuranosylrhamnosyl-N-acetylglucosaminyl-diphospho-decaprenol beta-1,5/1,6-galactofuranosyltransferase
VSDVTEQNAQNEQGEQTNPTELRVLQRVVFPVPGNLDVVPLYVETNMERGFGRQAARASDEGATGGAQSSAVPGETESAVGFATTEVRGAGDLTARRRGTISAGRRVSFGAYFNAFPASYWSRWTSIDEIVLRVKVKGACSVIVYRSTAKGKSHPVDSITVTGNSVEEIRLTLPLRQFIDGGWYWFDIAAAQRDVTLLEADWSARTDRTANGTFSIAMTTHNRPTFCIDGLKVLADSPDVLEILDRIYVRD